MSSNERLIEQLNYFLGAQRQTALSELHKRFPEKSKEKPWVNMHVHSFFSYHGEGWSPSRIAWEAYRQGLYALGLCDFDTLTGMKELFMASDILELRTIASFESRVFFSEYADQEINSPGEPGVFYFIGAGFVDHPDPAGRAGQVFGELRTQAHHRNRELLKRINSLLPDLALDYGKDVLPLTPSDNPTERHIVRAYFDKSLLLNDGDRRKTAKCWAELLHEDTEQLQGRIGDLNNILDFLRTKIIKQGGLAYRQPDASTFPSLDRVTDMILACRAVPVSAWLDGSSAGESDPRSQLECLVDKGVGAVNIVPDRNWNYQDPDLRKDKVAKLHSYVEIADKMELPILVGTEMNKSGQRFIDDFDVEPMKKVASSFLRGAQIMVGHTRLLRYADFSYVDDSAVSEFPERRKRNEFFASVGGLPAPPRELSAKLQDMAPGRAYAFIHDSVAAGQWKD